MSYQPVEKGGQCKSSFFISAQILKYTTHGDKPLGQIETLSLCWTPSQHCGVSFAPVLVWSFEEPVHPQLPSSDSSAVRCEMLFADTYCELHITEFRAGQTQWWRKTSISLVWFFSPPLLWSRLWAGKWCPCVLLTCWYHCSREVLLFGSMTVLLSIWRDFPWGRVGVAHSPDTSRPQFILSFLPSPNAPPLHLSPAGGGLRPTNPPDCGWAQVLAGNDAWEETYLSFATEHFQFWWGLGCASAAW